MVVWARRRRPAFRRSGPGHTLIEDAQCALDGGSICLSVLRVRWCEWHVDVFEDSARSNTAKTQRRFDEVVARQARVFAAQIVGEKERFGELTSVHEETRAVDGPLAFNVHNIFTPYGEGGGSLASFWLPVAGFSLLGSRSIANSGHKILRPCMAAGWTMARGEVTVRARRMWVNYIRIVQRWNSLSEWQCDESRSRRG